MTEHIPQPPQEMQYDAGRAQWLTDAGQQINMDHTIIDPRSLRIKAPRGDHVTVPAVVEMPNTNGGMDSIAVVRHENRSTGAVQIALHGLRRARDGSLRANRRGVAVALPTEEEGPQRLALGNGRDISRRDLFGRGRRQPEGFNVGDEALDMLVTPDGELFVASTRDQQRVARLNAEILEGRRVTGRVRVGIDNPLNASYRTPEEIAAYRAQREENLRDAEQAAIRAEADRVARIFAPRDVPDLTAGQRSPAGYEGLKVTDASRASAREWMQRALYRDSEFEDIIEEHIGHRPQHTEIDGLIDSIRTDGELRARLGRIYQDRIYARLHLMGDNIKRVSVYKNPNSRGYEGMRLKTYEYAAVLALSHLDGTFNPQNDVRLAQESDLNEFGWPKIDQHRAAARFAIDGLSGEDRLREERQRLVWAKMAEERKRAPKPEPQDLDVSVG